MTFFSLGSEPPVTAVAPSVRVQDEPNATGSIPSIHAEAPVAAVAAGVSMAAVAAVVLNAQVQDDADDTGRIPSIRAMLAKVLLICGGMGSGKTYRVAEYVEQGPEKPVEAGQEAVQESDQEAVQEAGPETKTALSVACRISMAETITGRMAHLGFVSYKDHEAVATAKGRRRMVCEYESLDRLVKEPAVDILIIDEARAVMKAVTCYETNGDQLIPNYEMLLRLARRCKKLIVMCADLNMDLAVQTFINDVLQVGGHQTVSPWVVPNYSLWEEQEGKIVPPPPRPEVSVRRINVPKPVLQRTFVQAPRAAAMLMMVSDIRNGRKVIACFGSKSYMDSTEANIQAEDPDINIRKYSSDSPHKAELADIDTHWAVFDVIFYTATITVALDYNGPVHRVYLFPDIFTCTPRDLLQMAGRGRCVITGEIIVALPKRAKKKKGKKRRPQIYYSGLPKTHDMIAATEAEVTKIMESRDVRSDMMVQMRNRFLVDDTSDTIKYLPDHMTKIWACNRAEETLKVKLWYPLFFWAVEMKGYEWRMITPEEVTEVGADEDDDDDDGEESSGDGEDDEDESSDGPLEQFQVFNAIDMKEAEKQMMAEVDVMSFTRNDEKHLLSRKISGNATPSDIAALKKYNVQKHFRQELSIDDICTVLRKKRAILNVCSMLKLTVQERAEFFLVEAQGKKEHDFLRADYPVLRQMDHLLRMLGYSGLNDRTTSINVMALDEVEGTGEMAAQGGEGTDESGYEAQEGEGTEDAARKAEATRKLGGDVARRLGIIRKLTKQDRNRANSTTAEIKGVLKRLLGLHLKGARGGRPDRIFGHKIQEVDDIWRVARIDNIFFMRNGRQP